ncbi:similar to s-layer associated multidomain endoglucanase [Stanieria sp. NIES-3757]|nr:similar to s-layer associated multidomain endoglucanase [Stanieria sp. NIES-3757]
MFRLHINKKKFILIGFVLALLSSLIISKQSPIANLILSPAIAHQPKILNASEISQTRNNSICSSQESLPWLKTDGKWITDEAGNQVTLRGISFCGFNNAWGEKVLPDFQDKVARVTNGVNGWYPNLLRLPIKHQHMDTFSLEEIYQALKAGVDECVKQKVYCIIDWHAVDGEDGADWRSLKTGKQTRDFWSYMAPRFKDYSNVIFELYNEPGYPKDVTEENWLIWRSRAQPWVNLIRENAPSNLILINSPLWSQITQFAPQYPFFGDNLAYVNHTYPGMEESWPKDVGMEYDWEEVFGKAADSVPVFITEFGWQADAEWEFSRATTAEFGQPIKDFLSKRPNINWVIWTYDHYCSPRLADESDRVLGGKKMGIFVRDWLKEEWQRSTNPTQFNCDK